MENLDWMSVAKVLLLAWKLRMQLSKKQEKTRKSRGRSFLLTMNSLVWSVRWQLSNLESITKEKTHGNYCTSTSYHWETQTGSDEKKKHVGLVITFRRSSSSTRKRKRKRFGRSNISSPRRKRKKPQRKAVESYSIYR